MLRTLFLAASLLLSVGLSSTAHASMIPVLDTVTLVGTEYEFSYSATLAGDTGLVDGNRLVIFDFQGYVDGSISPGIYGASIHAYVELTSTLSASMLGYDDDPTIENLVFEWKDNPFSAAGGPFLDVSFVALTARSIYSATHIDGYAALTVINNGGATGLPAFNAGPVAVPAAVPEPAALGLLAMGIAGLARRRARG